MKTTVYCLLGLAAVVWCGAAAGEAASADADLGVRALERTGAAVREEWAYTETTVEGELTTVRRFDPRRAPGARWELVSVDGREPTAAEEEEFGDDADDGRADPDDEDDDEVISAMVRPGSLVLLQESDADARYRFEPMSDDPDDEKLYRHLDATLKVVKAGPYVSTLEMKSLKPFSLGFGKKVKEFYLAMDFAPVEPGGEVLLRRVTVRIHIRAMLVMKVRQTVEVNYTDFEFIGSDGRADGAPSPEAG